MRVPDHEFLQTLMQRPMWVLLGILLLGLSLRLAAFTGYTGIDDITYISDAYKWSEGRIEASRYFGSARVGMIGPLAILFQLFGPNLVAVAGIPLFWSTLCIPLAYATGKVVYGDVRTALLAALFVAVFPLDVIFATLRWRQFDGQSGCLRLLGKGTFPRSSEYRCLFSVLRILACKSFQHQAPIHARRRFQRAPQRGQHGRRAPPASIPTHEPIGKPTARPLSRPRLDVARQPNVLGQPGQGPLLLPQVPQSRQPTGTLGGSPQALAVRRRRRSMPRLGPRSPLDSPLVTPPLQPEQKRRGTGTLNHQETLPFPTTLSIRTVRETGTISETRRFHEFKEPQFLILTRH